MPRVCHQSIDGWLTHEPEGHGFNRAVKSRGKGQHLAAAGRSEGVAATTELLSLVETKQPGHRRVLPPRGGGMLLKALHQHGLREENRGAVRGNASDIPIRLGAHARGQFSRCGYAFTPACGSEVFAFGLTFYGMAEAMPFRFTPQQSVGTL